MKKLLLIAIMFALIGQSVAQIGKSKQEIIAIEGYEYELDHNEHGEELIYTTTRDDGNKYITYYMFKNNICYLIVVADHISNVNKYINIMNNKYVRVSTYKWRDYVSEMEYSIETDENICFIFIHSFKK